MHTDLAWIYLLNGQYEQAREQCLHSLNMEFNFPLTHVYLGHVFLYEERFQEGIEELRKALPAGEPGPAPIVAMLGYAYGVTGQTGSARQALRQIEELSEKGYVSPYDRAVIYAGLGDKTEAFRWLDHAFVDRSPRVIWLNVEPAFKTLGKDRRFKTVVRRLKLT
jgi:tetratricopeptide (TPR) repeat protein